MKKLSVLVCLYNTPTHLLANCLDSIFASSINNDLQVVVVDDGSQVNYSETLSKYSQIEFYKVAHGGTLNARLFAISLATAPYACFVDADDTVSCGYFEANVFALQKYDADFVLNDWAENFGLLKYYYANDYTIANTFCLSQPSVLPLLFCKEGKQHSFYVLWNKTFKTSLLQRVAQRIYSLKIDPIVYAEDVLICFFAYSFAQKVANTHLGFYFYRHHLSQQTNATTKQKTYSQITSSALVFDVITQTLQQSNKTTYLLPSVQRWKNNLFDSLYHGAKKYNLHKYLCRLYDCEKSAPNKRGKQDVLLCRVLLPSNVVLLDEQIANFSHVKYETTVYCQKGGYCFRQLNNAVNLYNLPLTLVTQPSSYATQLEKEQYSFVNKLRTNKLLYKTSLLLFPRGSQLRNAVKNIVYRDDTTL